MAAFLWVLLGVVSGACIAVQAPINTQLAKGLGLPVGAAAISFLAGAVILVALTAILGRATGVTLNWGAPAPWLYVAGGCLGAVYVTSTILLTPQIGAAAVMALAVTGQLVAGLLIDRTGFLGMAVREITMGRLAGAVLLVVGVVMIRML